jgi:quercetin dioxygenase-like cupin family protein
MLHRVFKPGEDIGFHTHQGVEISWVVRGTIELRIRGGANKIYHPGESFQVPRGTVHDPVNVGKDEAEVAVNYVLDKGAPMRDPVK